MKNLLAGIAIAALFASACQAQGMGDTTNATAPPDATNGASVAAPTNATAPTPTPTPAAAPAPALAAGEIPPPPDGKGEVVFYRKLAFTGMAVWFNVRENGSLLGKLSNGVYFVVVTDPGPHTYTAATENKDTLKLEVDPGETYYVEGRVTMGVMIGEANLAPTDQASFDKVGKHLKLLQSSPPPAAH